MTKETQVYEYTGAVKNFNTVVAHSWKASTSAPTEQKARSNIIYQYKRKQGLMPSAKITLEGKLRVVC